MEVEQNVGYLPNPIVADPVTNGGTPAAQTDIQQPAAEIAPKGGAPAEPAISNEAVPANAVDVFAEALKAYSASSLAGDSPLPSVAPPPAVPLKQAAAPPPQAQGVAAQVQAMVAAGDFAGAKKILEDVSVDLSSLSPVEVLTRDMMKQYPRMTKEQAEAYVAAEYADADKNPAVGAKLAMEASKAEERLRGQIASGGTLDAPSVLPQTPPNYAAGWNQVLAPMSAVLSKATVGDFTFNYPPDVVSAALEETMGMFAGRRPAADSLQEFVAAYHFAAQGLALPQMIASAQEAAKMAATQKEVMRVVGVPPESVRQVQSTKQATRIQFTS